MSAPDLFYLRQIAVVGDQAPVVTHVTGNRMLFIGEVGIWLERPHPRTMHYHDAGGRGLEIVVDGRPDALTLAVGKQPARAVAAEGIMHELEALLGPVQMPAQFSFPKHKKPAPAQLELI